MDIQAMVAYNIAKLSHILDKLQLLPCFS